MRKVSTCMERIGKGQGSKCLQREHVYFVRGVFAKRTMYYI